MKHREAPSETLSPRALKKVLSESRAKLRVINQEILAGIIDPDAREGRDKSDEEIYAAMEEAFEKHEPQLNAVRAELEHLRSRVAPNDAKNRENLNALIQYMDALGRDLASISTELMKSMGTSPKKN